MRLFVAVTDYEWFRLHASKPGVEEVNFWRPSPRVTFKALQPGELFLFKLHAPRNYIAGGGFFSKFVQLPVSLAWEAFGEGNGARSLAGVRGRIAKYRSAGIEPGEDPEIGCILLAETFFFPENDWIPCPSDFSLNTQVGKTFDISSSTGRDLWLQVSSLLEKQAASDQGPAIQSAIAGARYGQPVIVIPRLGQGLFRILVTEAYRRRCAVTLEKTLPALEAAHVRPFAEGGEHSLSNGILLRSDLHKLLDHGYITIDPDDTKIVVSQRIKEEFENGKEYYRMHGRLIAPPAERKATLSRKNLVYHAQNIFH